MLRFLVLRVPSSLVVPIYIALTGVGLLYRFLFGSAFGLLLLALAAYWLSPRVGGPTPLSASELFAWAAGLSSEYKVAVLSGLVTVVGFIVAFHTATVTWHSETNARLRADVAGEIEGFFAPLASNVTSAMIYAKTLVRTVNQIQGGCSALEADGLLAHVQRETQRFFTARAAISEASSNVYRLVGRNYSLLASQWGVMGDISTAVAALGQVSRAMWIRVPAIDLNDPARYANFIADVNVAECLAFVSVCETRSDVISTMTGSARGVLMAPIVGFGWPSLFHMIRERRDFRQMAEELRRNPFFGASDDAGKDS